MLRRESSPLPVRLAWGVFHFCASLKLAVLLIFSLATVLAVATFVESAYGTRAVHFAVYGSWWFTLLGLLLAVNIFCAAAIRYPWKRHQTGFVITHIGLLTLLFGCLLSRKGGIDAQMPIFEDQMNHLAVEDSSHFHLTIHDHAANQHDPSELVETRLVPSPTQTPVTEGRSTLGKLLASVPVVNRRTDGFRGGPLNWDDLERLREFPDLDDWRAATEEHGAGRGTSSWLGRILMAPVWSMAAIDRGAIYDQDGIRLEVLDYYSDSREIDAPLVELMVSTPRMPRGVDEQGREKLSPESWAPVALAIARPSGSRGGALPFRPSARRAMGGGSFVFWMTESELERQAFVESRPEGAIGPKGQVRLLAGGAMHTIDVASHADGERFALGESGLEARVAGFFGMPLPKEGSRPEDFAFTEGAPDQPPEHPVVEVLVYQGQADELAGRVVLFADRPEISLQDATRDVYGTFWFDRGEKSSEEKLRGGSGSRIDVVQAPGEKLFYRYWNGRELVLVEELPTDGTKVDAFKMPIAQLQMYVDRYVPSDRPEKKVLPAPFNKDTIASGAQRATKLRMTVDDVTDEFWLVGGAPGVFSFGSPELKQHTVTSSRRSVTISSPLDEVDIGFNVRLQDFEQKLDPGTSQPSSFSSRVDFLPLSDATESIRRLEMPRDVVISMNAPVDFSDPQNGRSYRLFQESRNGPFRPGHPFYDANVNDPSQRSHLWLSILTVNYDPGRGVKYLGCLLIVVGIVTMFYMRAYFFKPKGHGGAAQAPTQSEATGVRSGKVATRDAAPSVGVATVGKSAGGVAVAKRPKRK